jgi:hypothetical protein
MHRQARSMIPATFRRRQKSATTGNAPNVFSILAATYRPAAHEDNTALWQAAASDTSTMHRRNPLISMCGMCGTQG